MKKILIPYSYPKRELEYLAFLAAGLIEAGWEVKLAYVNFELFDLIRGWQPDVLLLGQVSQPEAIEFAKYAHKVGVIIIVLSIEGCYDPKNVTTFFGDKVNDFLDRRFVWGQQHYDDALRLSDINKKKLIVTGTPKFDLYKHPFVENLQLHKPYQDQLIPNKKTICVATSLASTEEEWDRVQHISYFQNMGQEFFYIRRDTQRKLRDAFIKVANELIRSNKYNVIFRPSPLENLEYYKDKLHKGCIFDNQVTPVKLFSVIDLLVHRTSTLATEAWLLQIPTVSYDPMFNKDGELTPLVENNPLYHEHEKLMEFLHKPDSWQNSKFTRKIKHYLWHWYHFRTINSDYAYQRIINNIQQLSIKKKRTVWHPYHIVNWILRLVKIFLRKKYVYEVIGLIKGAKYIETMVDNFVEPSVVEAKILKYRNLQRLAHSNASNNR